MWLGSFFSESIRDGGGPLKVPSCRREVRCGAMELWNRVVPRWQLGTTLAPVSGANGSHISPSCLSECGHQHHMHIRAAAGPRGSCFTQLPTLGNKGRTVLKESRVDGPMDRGPSLRHVARRHFRCSVVCSPPCLLLAPPAGPAGRCAPSTELSQLILMLSVV